MLLRNFLTLLLSVSRISIRKPVEDLKCSHDAYYLKNNNIFHTLYNIFHTLYNIFHTLYNIFHTLYNIFHTFVVYNITNANCQIHVINVLIYFKSCNFQMNTVFETRLMKLRSVT